MGKLDYLHYAEADYKFAADTYKAGIRGNMLCTIAEQACEKYIKHVICLLENKDSSDPSQTIRFPLDETHHPGKLARKLRDYGEHIPGSFVHQMNSMQSYYRDVRYPGYYTAHDADEEEIQDCMKIMTECRSFCQRLIKNIETKRDAEKDNEDIDFGVY